jgi:hypothetical protein
MTTDTHHTTQTTTRSTRWLWIAFILLGIGTFVYGVLSDHPKQAWQAYLVNFLVWSAIAQGGLLFSAIMLTTRARWSEPLAGLAEAFAGFFPVSFVLFLILFVGAPHLFPWLKMDDLHGKEVWLNIPFLFTRDCVGLLLLYGLGFVYLYHKLLLKSDGRQGGGAVRAVFLKLRGTRELDTAKIRRRLGVISILYMLAFALVLSLIGYDLVMSMDPHWISTLFGAYSFVKAIFLGFGALIIGAAFLHLNPQHGFTLKPSQFHDIGKLFFAFCLVWADFFYVQLVVIWYGNIPEETVFVIERVIALPWRNVAWTVFIVCFIMPFCILLRQKVKMMPKAMILICTTVIIGMILEHYLLIAPALGHGSHALLPGLMDVVISLGFLGLLVTVVGYTLRQFPELLGGKPREVT